MPTDADPAHRLRLRDRRLGRRRRHAGRAAGRSRACASACSKPAAIRALAAPRAAGRLRRAGVPRLRLREPGDAAGTSACATTPTRRSRRATRNTRPGEGVLYPRAGTLGGCTAHNAMIFVLPHDCRLEPHRRHSPATGPGAPARMRALCAPLENCHHRPLWRAAAPRSGSTAPAMAGTAGCAPRSRFRWRVLRDDGLLRRAARHRQPVFTSSLPTPLLSAWRWLRGGAGDPNARRFRPGSFEGAVLHAADHHRAPARRASRERLLDVAARHPDRLHIELDALATRVLFDADGAARGVEYLKGERLYRAHASPSEAPGERRAGAGAGARSSCAGGAFNTPQLLMLSGIGPAEAAARARHRAAGRPAAASAATCRTATKSP